MHPLRKRKESDPDSESPAQAKRPRIDTIHVPFHRSTAAPAAIYSPLRRAPSDIEDIGIVVTSSDPGPSSGSLLRERHIPPPPSLKRPPATPTTPILNSLQPDYSSPHIPPLSPLINRQTLRELDLDVIIRNPVLRHDLLFDAGLQFRPRRKSDLSERYWKAVFEEVKTGCTCITLEYRTSKPLKTVCMCARCPEPPPTPLAYLITSTAYTIRMPSRVRTLLNEFLEVMLFVIQPLSNTAVYSNPNDVREQAREHSQHAAYLKQIFDPAFIYQELKHNVFDPSGVFVHIGEMLKNHCAPMRDRTVDELVRLAQQPGVEGLKAFRASLELLEQMKLDIANHQLTQLRPWLLRNTGSFEIKAFKMRFGHEPSLHNTREWLYASHRALTQRKESIAHPSYVDDMSFKAMTRNQQVYMSVLRGLVDIVFDSFTNASCSNSPPSTPVASVPPTPLTPSPVSGFSTFSSAPPTPSTSTRPETLYLDKTRLNNFSSEASDVTALYMLMLLFRQLAFMDVGPNASTRPVRSVDEEDLLQLRQELIDIGPAKMGACFVPRTGEPALEDMTEKQKKDIELRRSVRLDLVLQVAKRASDLRRRNCPASSVSSTPYGDAPDSRLVNIATTWAETNMQPGSSLSVLLHNRMREVLFDLVVSLAYPGKDVVSLAAAANGTLRTTTSVPGTSTTMHTSSVSTSMATCPAPKNSLPMVSTPEDDRAPSSPITTTMSRIPSTTTSSPHLKIDLYTSTRLLTTAEAVTDNHQPGMEGILDDARELAEKLARLALIHLNTFLAMYESEGFLIGLDGSAGLVRR
ncbi:T-complex protein 11-domain-containing protein [Crepidotus variabilis]|uniref:T-complex protein 11-domain-containing protein n=1 Tax=Crepidotus variabilis TaxID=179855 RepID=A0A9P6ERB6_9AGAR|nr:T-complex protein 11-domain-containing protein [Crepidotus variabilis]